MTIEIPLSKGKIAIIDDNDFPLVSRWSWHYMPSYRGKGTGYAIRNTGDSRKGESRTIYMHREILGANPGEETDHIDGNGLNNTRSNLRLCKHTQNTHNRSNRSGISRFKGVTRDKTSQKWRAKISDGKKQIYLGLHDNEESAAHAYDVAAKRLHGAFARLNFPPDDNPVI